MVRGRPYQEITKAGDRHNYLVAVARVGKTKNGTPLWRYVCDCGMEVIARSTRVRAGEKASCGCHKNDHLMKHGLCRRDGSAAPEYNNYTSMLKRCGVPGHRDYAGRGITICERWKASFADFLNDMGPRPSDGHSIDRIDPNGNYEPTNCRWATRIQQANNRRHTPLYLFEGEMLPVSDIAARTGAPARLIRSRLANGWPMERAITEPYRITEAGRLSAQLERT